MTKDRVPQSRDKTRSLRLALCTVPLAVLFACSPFREPPFPPVPPGVTGRVVTRADAIADLDAMMRMFEDVHPDLYAVWPRDSAASAHARLVAALPDTMSRIEWWKRLAPFVASFGDGHTNVQYPGEEVRRAQLAGTLVFPPSVALSADGHLVVAAPIGAGPGVSRDDRIVSINGLDADSLVRAWALGESGESEAYREASVIQSFRDHVLLAGVRAPFSIGVATADNAPRIASVDGIAQDSLAALVRRGRANAVAREPWSPNFVYRLLDRGTGYINFRSMAGDINKLRPAITGLFREVAADSVRTLILDLRDNGGGDSRIGEAVLQHFTTKAYRTESRKDWKMSAEYRAYFATGVAAPVRALHLWALHPVGREMFGGAPGKFVTIETKPAAHSAAQPFFNGAVCVLIGPRSFSSAVDISDAIKTYGLARLIGEETGGRPNSFGEGLFFRLPRSGLSMSVSSARFVRANGDTTDHRGVVPDEVIVPTRDDWKAGRDAVLERARSCQRS